MESKMNVSRVGNGKVYLIAGGGRIYTEMVAKFCRSGKSVEEIIASPYTKKLLKSIVDSSHQAALEFDNYLFGIEGFSRCSEVDLVRKRHASYMISSNREDKHGTREFNVVMPEDVMQNAISWPVDTRDLSIPKLNLTLSDLVENGILQWNAEKLKNIWSGAISSHNSLLTPWAARYLQTYVDTGSFPTFLEMKVDTMLLLELIAAWYAHGVSEGLPEQHLQYLKPQGSEFRAAVMMNASGLHDFFRVRMCRRARPEMQDLATKMYKAVVEVHPDIFEDMGPSCKLFGYCPEMEQCKEMKGKIPTRKEAMKILAGYTAAKNKEGEATTP